MSKTHTNTVIEAGKKVAKWLHKRMQSQGVAPPTCTDIMTQVHQGFPGPQWSSEDQIAIGRCAMALYKKADPEGWGKFRAANPEVEERAE